MSQKGNETISQYFYRIKQLAYESNPNISDDIIVRKFEQGLANKYFNYYRVLQEENTSLEKLEYIAFKLDSVLIDGNDDSCCKRVQNHERRNYGPYQSVCFNMNGSFKRKDVFCYFCGRRGHKANKCWFNKPRKVHAHSFLSYCSPQSTYQKNAYHQRNRVASSGGKQNKNRNNFVNRPVKIIHPCFFNKLPNIRAGKNTENNERQFNSRRNWSYTSNNKNRCFICNKFGHYKKQCYFNKNNILNLGKLTKKEQVIETTANIDCNNKSYPEVFQCKTIKESERNNADKENSSLKKDQTQLITTKEYILQSNCEITLMLRRESASTIGHFAKNSSRKFISDPNFLSSHEGLTLSNDLVEKGNMYRLYLRSTNSDPLKIPKGTVVGTMVITEQN